MKQVSTLSIVLQTRDTALGRREGVIFRHFLNHLQVFCGYKTLLVPTVSLSSKNAETKSVF